MKVWLITCLLLFILVELFQWVKGFILPLPLYLLAGAMLALASNYEKGLNIWRDKLWEPSLSKPQTPTDQGSELALSQEPPPADKSEEH
jgi:hypothetical protein